MKKKLFILSGASFLLAPVLALAQVGTSGSATLCNTQIQNLGDVICKVGSILNSIIPVLIVLGVVFFVWGVISIVIANDEEAKTKGRNKVIWGIIGLVVIVGMWGLVRIVTNTFGISNNVNVTLPTVPTGI